MFITKGAVSNLLVENITLTDVILNGIDFMNIQSGMKNTFKLKNVYLTNTTLNGSILIMCGNAYSLEIMNIEILP